MSFSVTLLGTGSPLPDAKRAGPSLLVKAGRLNLVADVGRGAMMRLTAAGVPAPAVTALLLTHLHSDHTQDLSDMITTRWVLSMAENPLHLIGPPGTDDLVKRNLEMMSTDIGFRLAHHEDLVSSPTCKVEETSGGVIFEGDGLLITAAEVDHAPVKGALGFRFDFEGRALVISGDTRPCDGLDQLCADADVYVQNVIRRSLIENSPLQRVRDIVSYHSSPVDTGETALRAGVGKVVLTHMVPPPVPGCEKDWIDEVRSAGFEGDVIVGEDLIEVEV